MGRRAADDTVGAIILALMKQRRWEQSQLARHLEVNVATLRRSLRRLQARDPSITSETDHPHVIWTVPRGWAPGALPLGAEGARALFHLLARTPGATRNELLGKVATLLPHAPAAGRMQQAVVVPALTEREEAAFDVLCDAATYRQAVRMRYHSERSNEVETRDVSPQKIIAGAVLRMLARCHRDDALKSFRLSEVEHARIEPSIAFREVDPREVETKIRTSVHGFSGGAPVWIEFDVRRAAWGKVRRNLPQSTRDVDCTIGPEWVGVRVETAGVALWARHAIGLGANIRVPDGLLRAAIAEMLDEAREALALV